MESRKNIFANIFLLAFSSRKTSRNSGGFNLYINASDKKTSNE